MTDTRRFRRPTAVRPTLALMMMGFAAGGKETLSVPDALQAHPGGSRDTGTTTSVAAHSSTTTTTTTTIGQHSTRCSCGDIWQYDGCYRDVRLAGEESPNATVRRLAHILRVIPNVRLGSYSNFTNQNSRATCYDDCQDAGYGPGLVGLESGDMCWCADVEFLYDLPDDSRLRWDGHVGVNRTSASFWDSRRADDSMCNMTCPGDPTTACGGDLHVALYNHIDCQYCPGASSSTTTTTSMVVTVSDAPFLTTATPIPSTRWPKKISKLGLLSFTNLGIVMGLVVVIAMVVGIERRIQSGSKRRRQGVPKSRVVDGDHGATDASESSEDLTNRKTDPATTEPASVNEDAPPAKRGRSNVYEGDVDDYDAGMAPDTDGSSTSASVSTPSTHSSGSGEAGEAGEAGVAGEAGGHEMGFSDEGDMSAGASTLSPASTPGDPNTDGAGSLHASSLQPQDTGAYYTHRQAGLPGSPGFPDGPNAAGIGIANDASGGANVPTSSAGQLQPDHHSATGVPGALGQPLMLLPSTTALATPTDLPNAGFKLLLPPTLAMAAYPVAATPLPTFIHHTQAHNGDALKTSKSKISFEKYEIEPDTKPVTKTQRFVTQTQSEWRKSLHAAVKSAFAKLDVQDKRIADILMGRIIDGAQAERVSSKRQCFLVQRKNLQSKSPFQISIGGSRMVVQKVLYASYNRVTPAELNTSQVGQQCLHNDESWWCFEPSHLHHFEKDHRPAGSVRCKIPGRPDAFFISQMRPSIRVMTADPNKTPGLAKTGEWTLSRAK